MGSKRLRIERRTCVRFGFIEAEMREKGQVGLAEHCGGYAASDRNRKIRWPIIWMIRR
jgi:hypothetical protein